MPRFIKFSIFSIVMIISICSNAFASAQSENADIEQQAVYIIDKNVTEKIESLLVTGKIPQVHFVQFDPLVEQAINVKINEKYTQRLKIAEASMVDIIDFQYQIIHDGEYLSLLISSESKGIDSKKAMDIVNIDTSAKKIIFINDILGPNGVKLVNRVINEEIALAPEKYISEFAGVTNEHDFYIEERTLILIFNQNSLVTEEELYSITIDISGVINTQLPVSMYETDKNSYNLKMIPLRHVIEAFGFVPEWFEANQTVDIKRDDPFYSSMRIGENMYFRNTSPKRLLESAPILINDRTYVPISYFEEFLLLFYTIDIAGTITFSEYRNIDSASGQ